MGEYFGDPHHWRMCSKDSMQWARWRLAAISRTAPSSVSKPFPMGAFARTAFARTCLQLAPIGGIHHWLMGNMCASFLFSPDARGVGLFHPSPLFPLPPWASSTAFVAWRLIGLRVPANSKGHFSKRLPTEPPSLGLGRKKAPALTPVGGLTVHYQLSPRKPQSVPPPPVHEFLTSLPRAWGGGGYSGR